MIDIRKLQEVINNLQDYFNKRARPLSQKDLIIFRCALGVCEEAGEIAHVVLKNVTGHYGFDDYKKTKEKLVDAVCDMTVFGLQILNEIDVDFEEVFPKVLNEVVERNEKGLPHTPLQK